MTRRCNLGVAIGHPKSRWSYALRRFSPCRGVRYPAMFVAARAVQVGRQPWPRNGARVEEG